MAEPEWVDEDGGRLVRPFAMARGRTRPGLHDLDMITLVVSAGRRGRPPAGLEYSEILDACRDPVSVAEVAAAVNLPIVVVKVLLSDLIEEGDVFFRAPVHRTAPRDRDVLTAVLDGLRRL
jgi:hypothetical protein